MIEKSKRVKWLNRRNAERILELELIISNQQSKINKLESKLSMVISSNKNLFISFSQYSKHIKDNLSETLDLLQETI
jgi:hypothetical protein|tara:strand:- start:8049 stop:8279 length:231 start_codon:yes stop_codon:yes gene_type:complete